MQPAPLDSNQWHDAIVGDLTVRQDRKLKRVVEELRQEWNNVFMDLGADGLPGFGAAEIPPVRQTCDEVRWRICAEPPAWPESRLPFPVLQTPRGWAGQIERARLSA